MTLEERKKVRNRAVMEAVFIVEVGGWISGELVCVEWWID